MRPRVQRAPGLPCALCLKRARTICKTSDKACRENEDAHLSSPRTRRPITPGVSWKRRHRPHRKKERTRRMGPRVREDDGMCVLVLATTCVRGLQIICAPKRRGRREDRVRAAPAVSCALCIKKKTHMSIQVQRKHSGLPCAVALRPMPCSPWRPCCATIAPERR